jgi:RND family efflux transporter MFP subunit
MKHKRQPLSLLTCLFLVIVPPLIGGAACALATNKRNPRGPSFVKSSVISRGDLRVRVSGTGRLEAAVEAQLRSRVGGTVEQVLVKEGEMVELGQILVKLHDKPFRIDLDRALSTLAEQQALMLQASQNIRRVRQLSRARAASQEEAERAAMDLALARARLRGANVDAQAARDQLQHTLIRAPFAGTVLVKNVNPGEVVAPGLTATVEGRSLLVLSDLSKLVVRSYFNQMDAVKLKVGQAARIKLDAMLDVELKATVSQIAAGAHPSDTGGDVFAVELALVEEHPQIRPGMTAAVEIDAMNKPAVVLVPVEAVNTREGRSFVQVVQASGALLETVIEIGDRNEQVVEVRAGLNEGDTIATIVAAVPGAS